MLGDIAKRLIWEMSDNVTRWRLFSTNNQKMTRGIST